MIETYTTIDGLLNALRAQLEADPSPFYTANIGQWLNSASDVDLVEVSPGVMREVHDGLYTGHHYEINIYTREFKDDKTRRRFE